MIDGYEQPSCSLVAAASVAPDDPLYGVKLDRHAALAHPWLPAFWEVVDLVLVTDAVVNEHACAI